MNINKLELFLSQKVKYQILYVLLVFILLGVVIWLLLNVKNKTIITYQGLINFNLIEINDVLEKDLLNISNCQELFINNKKNKYKLVDVIKNNSKYNLKIKINSQEFKNYNSQSGISFILKEETLGEFVIRNMKGEK